MCKVNLKFKIIMHPLHINMVNPKWSPLPTELKDSDKITIGFLNFFNPPALCLSECFSLVGRGDHLGSTMFMCKGCMMILNFRLPYFHNPQSRRKNSQLKIACLGYSFATLLRA